MAAALWIYRIRPSVVRVSVRHRTERPVATRMIVVITRVIVVTYVIVITRVIVVTYVIVVVPRGPAPPPAEHAGRAGSARGRTGRPPAEAG